jgi:hypothetical protein
MRHSRLVGIPFFALFFHVLLCVSGAPAQTFIPHPPPPPKYVVLDTRGLTTIKQELSLIAMKGYRAIYVAPRPGSAIWPAGMTIILEKLPDGVAPPEYFLAEEKNGSAIHHLLNHAQVGFRYVRNSAFLHRGHDFWGDFWATAIFGEKHVQHEKYDTFTNYVLLERSEDFAACRYQAQLTDPGKETLVPKHYFAEGFQIAGKIQNTVIFENCAGTRPPSENKETQWSESEAAERFRLVATNDFKKKQNQLTEAASQGFLVSHASGSLICLAKRDFTDATSVYKSLAAKTEAEMEKKMNEATGFRVLPETLARKNNFWSGVEYQIVMEKTSADGPQYRYRVLREKNGRDLQDSLNPLSRKGYEVKGMNRDTMGITVLMEKMVEREMPTLQGAEEVYPD